MQKRKQLGLLVGFLAFLLALPLGIPVQPKAEASVVDADVGLLPEVKACVKVLGVKLGINCKENGSGGGDGGDGGDNGDDGDHGDDDDDGNGDDNGDGDNGGGDNGGGDGGGDDGDDQGNGGGGGSRRSGRAVMVHEPAPVSELKDLILRITASISSVRPGGEITYYILYNNRSNETYDEVTVTVELPESVHVGRISDGGVHRQDEREVVWQIGRLAPHHGGVVSLTVQADATLRNEEAIILRGVIEDPDLGRFVVESEPVYVGGLIYTPVFEGYPDQTFRPDQHLSRAEAATVLARILNLQPMPQSASVFDDVPEHHWARGSIGAMVQQGLMYGEGRSFRPGAPISRAELVSLMMRVYVGEPHIVRYSVFDPHLRIFSDVTSDYWAYNHLRTAINVGLIDAGPTRPFGPQDAIARDEAARLIALGLRRGELVDGVTPVQPSYIDVDRDHWAFGWIAQLSRPAHYSVSSDAYTMQLIEYVEESFLQNLLRGLSGILP